jgi:hypothetical protein
MTLISWLLLRLSRSIPLRRGLIAACAIAVSALIFGLGHLPMASEFVGFLNRAKVLHVVVLSTWPGIRVRRARDGARDGRRHGCALVHWRVIRAPERNFGEAVAGVMNAEAPKERQHSAGRHQYQSLEHDACPGVITRALTVLDSIPGDLP